jgi:hypothetical protein
VDVTRIAQWSMMGISLAFSVLAMAKILARARRERRNGRG